MGGVFHARYNARVKRLRRIIINGLAAVSLLLFGATSALWIQSHRLPPGSTAVPRGLTALPPSSTSPPPYVTSALSRECPQVRFKDNRLKDLIDFCTDISGMNILVDWPALEAAGVRRETAITLQSKDERYGTVLTRITRAAGNGLRLVERDGAVYVTTLAAQARDSHVEGRVENPVRQWIVRMNVQPPPSPYWNGEVGSRHVTVTPSPSVLHVWLYPSDAIAAYQDDVPLGLARGPDEEVVLEVAGLSLRRARSPFHSWVFRAAYWELAVAFGVPPLLWIVVRGRRWRRRAAAVAACHCAECGYDLRATPERCPECGTIPAKAKA